MTLLKKLICSQCQKEYDPARLQTYCLECNSPLLAQYDLEAGRARLDRDEYRWRSKGMWRWHELLPVEHERNRLTLGEGDTPFLHLQRLGNDLELPLTYAKDEGINPTGSFKARGLAAAVSKAKELGIQKVIIPTAGNAGGAMAAYAARGGLQAFVFMPKDTPAANIEETQMTGAGIELVDGLISDAARLAGEKARQEERFDVSTFKEPYRTEGKKVMGYELAESSGWILPDVILYPTGGGTGLIGMWKAFAELRELGWLENSQMPRMAVVQAEGCAPVVKAFEDGQDRCVFWEGANTIAGGLRVPKSFADRLIMETIRESQGTAVAVSDEEIRSAQKYLAQREGIFTAPEAAATLAGLIKLKTTGWVKPEEKVVLFLTGAGIKNLTGA